MAEAGFNSNIFNTLRSYGPGVSSTDDTPAVLMPNIFNKNNPDNEKLLSAHKQMTDDILQRAKERHDANKAKFEQAVARDPSVLSSEQEAAVIAARKNAQLAGQQNGWPQKDIDKAADEAEQAARNKAIQKNTEEQVSVIQTSTQQEQKLSSEENRAQNAHDVMHPEEDMPEAEVSQNGTTETPVNNAAARARVLLHGNPYDNTLNQEAQKKWAESQQSDKNMAKNNMYGKLYSQEANRNPYEEAGKKATEKEQTENTQRVQQQSFSAGVGSARLRAQQAGDIQAEIDRQDRQRAAAEKAHEAAGNWGKQSIEEQYQGNQYKLSSRDYANDVFESNYLSDPGTGQAQPQQAQPQQAQPQQAQPQQAQPQQPQQPQPQEQEPVQQEQPQEQEPVQQEPEEKPAQSDYQSMVNYLVLGNKPGSDWNLSNDNHDKRAEAAKQVADYYGWTPITGDMMVDEDTPVRKLWEMYYNGDQNANDTLSTFARARATGTRGVSFDELWRKRSKRITDDDTQINAQNNQDIDEFHEAKLAIPAEDPPSDMRVKNIFRVLSDKRCKLLKAKFDAGNDFDEQDYKWLARQFDNKFKFKDVEYNTDDIANWNNEVLDGYADHIHNYLYTYTDDAKQVDPNIDTKQEHIGPMAQEIEQVNPACVKETPEGVKMVDTARLSMMNAGAIADLARQMKAVAEQLEQIKEGA